MRITKLERASNMTHGERARVRSARHRRILGFIVGVAVAKKKHLRDERALQELETILSIHDVRNIQEDKHMPLYCIDVLRNYIREAYASGKISRMDVRPFCIIHRNDYFIP
jgi:predicted membrane chloride channel (bestrophin family)